MFPPLCSDCGVLDLNLNSKRLQGALEFLECLVFQIGLEILEYFRGSPRLPTGFGILPPGPYISLQLSIDILVKELHELQANISHMLITQRP